MSDSQANQDRKLMRKWVETWLVAGGELDEVRRREIESADTQEAVRQLFGIGESIYDAAPAATSGLIEQQAWFARARSANRR